MHRHTLPLLQRAADGEIEPRWTTFVSPFDSLFWAQGRDELLWGFKHVLEAYKPAPQRVYGNLAFAILRRLGRSRLSRCPERGRAQRS